MRYLKRLKISKISIIFIISIVCVFGASGCKKVPMFAGEGAVLVISTDKTYLGTGGERAVISIMGFNSDGSALHDHIDVIFSASLGYFEPSEVEIISGRGSVEFRSGSSSGIAEIRARSGNITAEPNPLKITIGSAGLGSLSISANPSSFQTGGGRSRVQVIANDPDGNPVPNIRVVLTTTSGTFENPASYYTTNSQGMVVDYIHVTETAKVKAEAGSKSSEVEINVDDTKNILPTADFIYSPSPTKKGEAVHFNAGLSVDTDGTIVEYRWNFGDGKTGTGVTVDHVFNWTGSETSRDFTVILTVTDNSGGTDAATQRISVQGEQENKLPAALFSVSPESPKRGESVHFNGGLSSDPDGSVVAWRWDFGDGSVGAHERVEHTYTWTGDSAKSYIVVLTVTDDKGGEATGTQTLKVELDDNRLPTANFTFSPTNPKKNETVTFDASSSVDVDGSVVSWSWNFGDNTTGVGSIVNHTFTWTEVGGKAFSVILTVKDNRGGEGTALVKITVSE